MQFKGMSRSHLFLIELIVVVLFFSFSGAITLQVFSKAHQLAQSAVALNGAVAAVQTASETDRIVGYEDIVTAREAVYFNEKWETAEQSSAVYTMTTDVTLEKREAGLMAVYRYTVTSDEQIIYQLDTKKYYSGEAVFAPSPEEVN